MSVFQLLYYTQEPRVLAHDLVELVLFHVGHLQLVQEALVFQFILLLLCLQRSHTIVQVVHLVVQSAFLPFGTQLGISYLVLLFFEFGRLASLGSQLLFQFLPGGGHLLFYGRAGLPSEFGNVIFERVAQVLIDVAFLALAVDARTYEVGQRSVDQFHNVFQQAVRKSLPAVVRRGGRGSRFSRTGICRSTGRGSHLPFRMLCIFFFLLLRESESFQ